LEQHDEKTDLYFYLIEENSVEKTALEALAQYNGFRTATSNIRKRGSPSTSNIRDLGDSLFQVTPRKDIYMVLNEEQAKKKFEEHVDNSLPYLSYRFLLDHLPSGITEEILCVLHRELSEDKYECFLRNFITDFPHLVKKYEELDGRHVLAEFDHQEIPIKGTGYFLYRMVA